MACGLLWLEILGTAACPGLSQGRTYQGRTLVPELQAIQ